MDHVPPCFSERPFRSRPDGSLRKFPRRLGQFPLSFPVDSRWGPALSAMEAHCPRIPRLVEWREVGEDGTLTTVET